MKDFKGNKLCIGDEVVYVHGKNSSACLATRKVTKFYINQYKQEECSVGNATHILSSRIMKL